MRILLLLLALLIQPAPPVLSLVVPAEVQAGTEFLVSAAVFGEGSFDILLGIPLPQGWTTQDDLIRSVRVGEDEPANVYWRVRAGLIPGRYIVMIHTADVPAVVRTVQVLGRHRVWLPVVENSTATPVFWTWLPMVS